MTVTRFDPDLDLILIRSRVWGPSGELWCLCALDTGSTDTLIKPAILDSLGYNPRDADAITRVVSVIGEETGYQIRLQRFAALGHELTDFAVNAHDLPEDCGLDGLLGLNFLRRFNYEVRSRDGLVRLEPA